MPSVTYNGQSFSIDGRRLWVLGASIQYARIPRALWAARIADAKQAGFNTIETACPWCVHEPRRDRFDFEGQNDVREFITLCGKAGMRVILRPGPFIGSGFDGGGLPSWITQSAAMPVREANEEFLERVNIYFRRLLAKLEDLQATHSSQTWPAGGSILLVQSEHAWLCASEQQADRYLGEITRVIRESGFSVPVINANDLWQESPGTIDTWRGRDDLLAHLRQLRTVQPDAPRLLSALDAAGPGIWGDTRPAGKQADDTLDLMFSIAQCLAAGAQPVVSPFAAGTNFGFLGGRHPGGMDLFMTTAAAAGPPLGEAGHRGPVYRGMKRIISFASHFDHVFSELDADYHPIVADVFAAEGGNGSRGRAAGNGAVSIVPLRGSQGQIVFIFAEQVGRELSLLLEDGVRMPVSLGDQRVGWYVLDVDLKGAGRLDYSNLSPYAIVDRTILVLHGPEKSPAYLSINAAPVNTKVPSGSKPTVIDHKGVTLVICNREQIDQTYHDQTTVYVGCAGLDGAGLPIPAPGASEVWAVTRDATLRKLAAAELSPESPSGNSRHRPPKLGPWLVAPCAEHASGESPRYATLDGPETLATCGAPVGYGWYRVRFKSSTAKKTLCHLPHAADRVHLFMEGKPAHLFGVGPGATPSPFDLKLAKGDQSLVALVDNLGRFADGNDLVEPKGLYGHVYEVKALRAAKPKPVKAKAVDPFSLRAYIVGLAQGQLSDVEQVQWKFTHSRKTPMLIDVRGANASGTFVLNDVPIAYYAGASAGCHMRLMLDGKTKGSALKRGANVLRFAPDPRQDAAAEQIGRATTLYECVESLTESASWAFAKWEPPMTRAYREPGTARSLRGLPCWWRTTFPATGAPSQPLWLETKGLSKGQVFLNGHNLGRYFSATATGKAVGPQTRLFVPGAYLNAEGENELLIFDEHGCDPSRCKFIASETGDMD